MSSASFSRILVITVVITLCTLTVLKVNSYIQNPEQLPWNIVNSKVKSYDVYHKHAIENGVVPIDEDLYDDLYDNDLIDKETNIPVKITLTKFEDIFEPSDISSILILKRRSLSDAGLLIYPETPKEVESGVSIRKDIHEMDK